MLVPDKILRHVVFIGRSPWNRKPQPKDCSGTAFLVSVFHPYIPNAVFYHVVTAAHVAKEVGNHFWIRSNTVDGKSVYCHATSRSKWYIHPDPHVDLALADFYMPKKSDWFPVLDTMILSSKQEIRSNGIGLGDETFMPGLFWHHVGKKRNSPLLRMGNLAMLPEDLVPTESGDREAYLIECRSIGGASGSPVFIRRTDWPSLRRLRPGHMINYNEPDQPAYGAFWLLGVMIAHWDAKPEDFNKVPFRIARRGEGVNVGIALVTPAYRLKELLFSPELVKARDVAAKRHKRQNTQQSAATVD